MKRMAAILLLILLLLSVCGCKRSPDTAQFQVSFYYLRSVLTYGQADSVIAPEVLDGIDRESSLNYLMALYLNGPTDNRLYSPFPKDLEIQSIQRDGSTLTITVNDSLAKLKGMKLTKACACLALTCLDLTDAETVSIQAATELLNNQKSIDLTRDSLVLLDTAETTEYGGNS